MFNIDLVCVPGAPQGCSAGRGLRAGGDLAAGRGGQPDWGSHPAGQFHLQRPSSGCPGRLAGWVPTHLKPR